MKLYTIWLLFMFCQPFKSVTSSSCEKTLFYKYIPLTDTYRDYHVGYPFRGTSFMSPLHRRLARITDAAAITCSNVSSDVFLNYTYQDEFYRQDLVIVNSTIPVFPSNSSLSTFTTIRKLVLKNLGIEEVAPGAFGRLEVLQSLDLSRNRLRRIPDGIFDTLSTLNQLDLSNNRIDSVDGRSVSGLVGLKELYLNGNGIKVLRDDVFKDLTVLETLDVSDNPLEEFGNVGFIKLKKLLAKNNHLKRFDVDLSNLTLSHCDLSEGNLETVNFDNFPSMTVLNLAHNHLSFLDNFERFESGEVYLNHNKITKLESLPRNVKELDLSHNQIKFLKGTGSSYNSSLKYLNLNYNNISEIFPGAFWGLNNLRVLKMQHNNIDVLNETTFVNCSSLESVDLSYNQIFSIKSNVFSGVDKLKVLNVSHNNLQFLNYQMLPENSSLRRLYVDHNQITSFDAERFLYHFKNLKKISLNDNPWSCEILTNISHWLNVKDIKVTDATSSDNNNVKGISCKYDKENNI